MLVEGRALCPPHSGRRAFGSGWLMLPQGPVGGTLLVIRHASHCCIAIGTRGRFGTGGLGPGAFSLPPTHPAKEPTSFKGDEKALPRWWRTFPTGGYHSFIHKKRMPALPRFPSLPCIPPLHPFPGRRRFSEEWWWRGVPCARRTAVGGPAGVAGWCYRRDP